jgi:hypothetical protein
MVGGGEVSKDDLVWRRGVPGWRPIKAVPELGGSQEAADTNQVLTALPYVGNPLAVTALVFGLLGLLLPCLGLVAVILGVPGLMRARSRPGRPRAAMALAGIVLGAMDSVADVLRVYLIITYLVEASQ